MIAPRLVALGSFPMNQTLKTLMTAMLVLTTGFLVAVPTAAAHVCVFDNGEDCAADCADDGDIHVHYGPRLVPCVAVPTSSGGSICDSVGTPFVLQAPDSFVDSRLFHISLPSGDVGCGGDGPARTFLP